MISIKHLNDKDIDLCYELDSNTISLWSKKQWANEFKKEGTKIFGLLITNLVIGIFVLQVVLDEAPVPKTHMRSPVSQFASSISLNNTSPDSQCLPAIVYLFLELILKGFFTKHAE